MKPTKGYYWYCPDLGRLEAANIGVLLFCPEPHYLKALMSRNNRRISRFFGSEGLDWARINAFKRGLENRLSVEGCEIQTIEQLEKFIAQRANFLQITPPRPMKVTDPKAELEELFKELLGELTHHTSTKTLRHFLAQKFSAPEVEKRIHRDIKVRVPILEKEVEIPFGFQNGRFNLITPVRFEASNPEQTVVTACKYAVEGRSLYEDEDPQLGALQLVVVGKFLSHDQDSPGKVKRIFEDYNVKLFKMSEVPQLIDEIRTTGKELKDNLDALRPE